jgi:ABC-2 type transport system permease protein
VTPSTLETPPSGWVNRHVVGFGRHSLAVAQMEVAKIGREPTELLTRAIQPALWLIVFGQVFTRTRAIPTGTMRYLDYLAPGVLAQSVLFSAIFYGLAVIWERDLGVVHKLLVSPASRASLVFGKAISAGLRALAQAVIILALAAVLGVRLRTDVMSLMGVALVVVLGGALFSTFSFVIACLVKTRERFMGVGQVLTMPLFFASNAIYPLSMMPPWLRTISALNPLTYLVNALRALMIEGGEGMTGLGTDLLVLLAVFVVLVGIAANLYEGIVR